MATKIKKLSAGDTVRWSSQAGGRTTSKKGFIRAIVPAGVDFATIFNKLPEASQYISEYGGGIPRNVESYIIVVPGKTKRQSPRAYWPVPSILQLVKRFKPTEIAVDSQAAPEPAVDKTPAGEGEHLSTVSAEPEPAPAPNPEEGVVEAPTAQGAAGETH